MQVSLFRDLRQEDWASIEVYADRLAAGLARLKPAGWSFRASAPSGWVSSRFRTPSLYFSRVIVYGLYAKLARSDLHHVLDNSYGHLLYALDARRTVVTSHGGTPRSWRMWNRGGPAMRFFDWSFAGALRAARIIVVSDYARRELLQDHDYNPARIRVVHHGVDERFQPVSIAELQGARERVLQNGEAGLILHVGHCAPRKNVTVLLQAFAELMRHSSKAYRLLQIGGVWSPEQQSVIERSAIAAHVTQISHLPNADLPAYYSAADVFAFPSLYEGFGMPLIEAMACGAPVVCTDCELFREVCGDAARYADSRDPVAFAGALADMLDHDALFTELRIRGLARAAQFSWQKTARETLAVYRDLAKDLS